MKKIINRPETLVAEMCAGIALAHPELEYLKKPRVIRKRELNADKVTLISGGGSGHEPAHAGFVGSGLLDAAVCGDVFASPSQIQVYQAIRATAGSKGTLLIIKNYSGDIMNFRNAAHLATEDGIQVDWVRVDDDIAVEDSLYTVGHRGVAGTLLVHKLAGAASERGGTLAEVKRVAEKTAAHVRSIGFALTSCTVPAKGTPTFELGADELEYGVGIHGEPGRKREKIVPADELAARMTEALLKDLGILKSAGDMTAESSATSAEPANTPSRIALLINGFGGTPLQELYLLNHSVRAVLARHDIRVVRSLVGNYMTAIDMAGASVSILKLDDELESLLHEPCDAPALKISGPVPEVSFEEASVSGSGNDVGAASGTAAAGNGAFAGKALANPTSIADPSSPHIHGDILSLANLMFLVRKMGEIIIENEVPFCELDSHAGDGDFGMSVAKGFRQLQREWPEIVASHAGCMGEFLEACSLVIMEHCGGASGPIWGSAFRAAGRRIGAKTTASIADMANLLQAAVKGIQTTGERSFGRGAGVGDKTLMDALIPCADAWSKAAEEGGVLKEVFAFGAEAAVAGAAKTTGIVARMGRAGTVGERSLGYPDAGAHALGVIFTALTKSLVFEA